MNTLSAPSPRIAGESFIERRAGFILALCLHVIFFAGLAMRERPPIIETSVEPLREVHIQLAPPPPPEPAFIPSREVAPPVSDITREGADALGVQPDPASVAPSVETAPAVTPLPVNAMGQTEAPVTEATPAPAPPAPDPGGTLAAPVPAVPADPAAVIDPAEKPLPEADQGGEAIQSRLDAAHRAIEKERAAKMPMPDEQAEARIDTHSEQGSEAIAERLRMLDMDVKAKETLFRSKGAQEGVIRSLVMTGVDHAASQQVMDRYGIRIIPIQGSSPLPPSDGGANFLTQASTDVGKFVQGAGKGNYLQFIISRQAGMRMMQLETDEMEKRKFDPTQSRLVEVVFGIVATTEGYDLGVLKMVTEPQPSLATEKKNQDAPPGDGAPAGQ